MVTPSPAFTVTQSARAAGISASTVRLWAKEYAEYLSPGARPGKGEQRLFAPDDIAIFKTVRAIRESGGNTDQIIAALDAGERLETTQETPQDVPGQASGTQTALLPMELIQAIVTPYKQQIEANTARIERLEGELAHERAARLEAEKEASRLAGRLETMGEREESPEGKKKPFNLWAWLKGEG